MPAHKPEDCDRLFEYYLNAGDLNHLVMLFEDGCSLVRSDGGVGTGHAAVRAVFEPMLATRPRIKLEVVKVVRTGADPAIRQGHRGGAPAARRELALRHRRSGGAGLMSESTRRA